MTENSDKLDNMTVRRFAKLIKGNSTNNGSTGITTGTVIQNDNQLYVAVDDETLVPVSDTASNVNVGDKVTLAIDNEEALIVGNNSDASPTASELSETDTKATFAKVDASEAKDTAQTAQVTANTAQNTAETAQTTADNAQSTAQTAKETADAVDGKATEAKETATQAQATATTASETATQAQTTANTAQNTATKAQLTANTANMAANQAQATAKGAEKVATNYIDIDENKGITVGDMTAGTLGKNTYVDSDGFYIRDGEEKLASFTDSEISLDNTGKNTIYLKGKRASIYTGTEDDCVCMSSEDNLAFRSQRKKKDIDSAFLYLQKGVVATGLTLPDQDDLPSNSKIYFNSQMTQIQNDSVTIEGKPSLVGNTTISGNADVSGTIKQNGTQVSLAGHTHEAKDLTTSTPIFKKTSISTTYTCAANKGIAVSQTLPTMTGYTPFCLQGWGTNSGYMLCREYYISAAGKIVVDMYNVSSSSITNKLTCNLIYVKDGWF